MFGGTFVKVLALVMALLSAAPALAEQKGDCGTIVLPPGVGQSSPADISAFNPLFSTTAYNAYASANLYLSLVWINRFGDIDWSRSLASSVTTKDNTTFTVTLRSWQWSDGVPVTSSDVIYFYKLVKQYGPAWPSYGEGGLPDIITSVQAVSPTVFNITLKHAVNPEWFIYNGIGSMTPLPEHAWSNYTLDQMFQLQSTPDFFSVVDGPLKLQSIVMGQDAVFVPNPAYNGPKMHFSRIVYKFLEGDGVAVQSVESGDLDAAQLAPNLWDAAARVPGTHIEVLPASEYTDVMDFNLKNPKVAFFRDVLVRQAMSMAVNQDAMIKLVAHGNALEAYGPVPGTLQKFLPPEMRGGHYPLHYDPAAARALLLSDGYSPGPDGVMQKNGVRLSFVDLLSSGSGRIEEMDELLQQDFLKIGVEMKIHEIDFNQMLALMGNSPLSWDEAGDASPALPFPSGEGQYETGAFQNLGGYSDPKMDKLINDSINKPGLEGLFDYERYLMEQQPVIYFMDVKSAVLVNNRLHGMTDFVSPTGNYAPDQLYCTPEETAAK